MKGKLISLNNVRKLYAKIQAINYVHGITDKNLLQSRIYTSKLIFLDKSIMVHGKQRVKSGRLTLG